MKFHPPHLLAFIPKYVQRLKPGDNADSGILHFSPHETTSCINACAFFEENTKLIEPVPRSSYCAVSYPNFCRFNVLEYDICFIFLNQVVMFRFSCILKHVGDIL